MYSRRLSFEGGDWRAISGALVHLNPLIDALGGVIDWPSESPETIWGWSEQASLLIEQGLARPDILMGAMSQCSLEPTEDAILPAGPVFKAEVLIEILDSFDRIPAEKIQVTRSQLAVAFALRLLDEAANGDQKSLLVAAAACSVLLLEAGFWRGIDAEKEAEKLLRAKGGKKRAALRGENPEKAVAQACAKANPHLSALQIKTREKLKASDRTIRGWISEIS